MLLVAAEQIELEGIVSRLAAVRPLDWRLDYAVEGTHRGRRVVAVGHGPRPEIPPPAGPNPGGGPGPRVRGPSSARR